MIKPRNRHHSRNNNTWHVQGGTDLSCLWPVVQVILTVFMLIFVVGVLISAWPIFLVALIIFLIIIACSG